MSVSDKFKTFCSNLKISPTDISNISYRYKRITKQLNKDFWYIDNDTLHSLYVGSYGRDTDIVTSDVDMLMWLPWETYHKYDAYTSNGQSNLLQAVRLSIQKTYPTTHLRADGQVVVVSFDDGVCFEIVPCFEYLDKSYVYPDTNFGGSWRITNPRPEIKSITDLENECSNIKNLCRMARAWKYKWNVPMGGLLIDSLAHKFLSNWSYKKNSYLYYDYMTRDFLKFLSEQSKTNVKYLAVGSNDLIWRKGKFETIAEDCYNIALKAIEYEQKNQDYSANLKWREIYGNKFPLY